MTQPTLILVHGAFATSFSFAPLQAELSFHGVRSAAVDLPGHGFAATFPLGYQAPQDLARFTSEPGSIRGVTVDDNVKALAEAAARAKEHGPVVIVAHSRGGATLTALANAHPELIDHMVYVSAWAPVDLPAAEYNAEPEMKTVDNAALARALAGDPGQLGLLRCNFRQADPEVLDGLKALFCTDVSDDEFRIFLNSLQRTRTSTRAARMIVRRRAHGARSRARSSASARIGACRPPCRTVSSAKAMRSPRTIPTGCARWRRPTWDG